MAWGPTPPTAPSQAEMQTSVVPCHDPHARADSWREAEATDPGSAPPQATTLPQQQQPDYKFSKLDLPQLHVWQAVLFKSYTQTGQGAVMNHGHMPGVFLRQIVERAREKARSSSSSSSWLPCLRVEGAILICNSVSFGGKLNDILDLVILWGKSERKLIRTIHCKPKESSLSQDFIFQHLIWILKVFKICLHLTEHGTAKKNLGSGVTETWFQILILLPNTSYLIC